MLREGITTWTQMYARIMREMRMMKMQRLSKKEKACLQYLIGCYIADEVKNKYQGIESLKWTNANDIARYSKSLKDDKKDGTMPKRQSEIELRYVQWRK